MSNLEETKRGFVPSLRFLIAKPILWPPKGGVFFLGCPFGRGVLGGPLSAWGGGWGRLRPTPPLPSFRPLFGGPFFVNLFKYGGSPLVGTKTNSIVTAAEARARGPQAPQQSRNGYARQVKIRWSKCPCLGWAPRPFIANAHAWGGLPDVL